MWDMVPKKAPLLPSKGHIIFRDWLSRNEAALSSLINETSHPFALIPQAAHMQECAAQGKSLRGNFFMAAATRPLERKKKKKKKLHKFDRFDVLCEDSASLPTVKKKTPLQVFCLCSPHRDDLHQGLGQRYCVEAKLRIPTALCIASVFEHASHISTVKSRKCSWPRRPRRTPQGRVDKSACILAALSEGRFPVYYSWRSRRMAGNTRSRWHRPGIEFWGFLK